MKSVRSKRQVMDDYETQLAQAYSLSIQGKALLLGNKEFNPYIHEVGRRGLIESNFAGEGTEAQLGQKMIDYLGNWDYTPSFTDQGAPERVSYQTLTNVEQFDDHCEILEFYLKAYDELTGSVHPVDDLMFSFRASRTQLVFVNTRKADTPVDRSLPFTVPPFVACQANEIGKILRENNVTPSLDFLERAT